MEVYLLGSAPGGSVGKVFPCTSSGKHIRVRPDIFVECASISFQSVGGISIRCLLSGLVLWGSIWFRLEKLPRIHSIFQAKYFLIDFLSGSGESVMSTVTEITLSPLSAYSSLVCMYRRSSVRSVYI